MNKPLFLFAFSLIGLSTKVLAADAAVASASSGLFKMILGLVIVLGVMAVLAWLLRRLLPGAGGMHSVARIVGGVSVGSRERVVVVEVAGRWIVVGVAPGQVTAIANLDIGSMPLSEDMPEATHQLTPALNAITQPFSQWLKKSSGKFTENLDVEK